MNAIKKININVSVIIPVYNGAPFLAETINSVLASTYKNYEILLVDDGSTDNSKHICKDFERRYEHIRFYTFKKNKGLCEALNFALKKAHGTYICRINQDDTMTPDRIQKQAQYMKSHPDTVLLGSWLLVKDENGSERINQFLETDEEIKSKWLTLSPVWDAAVMYRKQAALDVGGYNKKYWPADDVHMWYRLGMVGKIANLQETLTCIMFHSKAVSVEKHKFHMQQYYRVHRWAHSHIQKGSWITQVYWISLLVAGYLFSAQFNWAAYRIIKYMLNELPSQLKSISQSFLLKFNPNYAGD